MYLRHSAIYLLAKLAPALASFIVLAAYTRWMSTEDYGIFTTILVVASSISLVSFGWLYVGIMRFWEQKTLTSKTIETLMTISIVTIALALGVGCLLFAFITGKFGIAISLFLVFLSSACYESFQRVNSITQQVNHYLYAEVGRTIITMLIGLLLVWSGYRWQGAITGVVVGIGLVLALSGALWRYFKLNWQDIDFALLKSLLIYGLPLSLSLVLLEIIHTSDRLLLGWLRSYAEAGEYAVAYNLPFQIIMMLTSSLNLAAYPVVIKTLEQQGKIAAETRLKDYLILLMGITLPAMIGLISIAPLFIPLLVGKEFVETSLQLLPWIGIAIFANCTYLFYVSLSFQLAKQTSGSVKVVALAALLNVVLNIAFVPTYGALGSTVASIIAYGLCLIYGYYLGNKQFALHIPWQELAKIVVATTIMASILYFIPVLTMPAIYQVMLHILVGGMVYSGLVWLLNIGNIKTISIPYQTRLRHWLPA